MTRTRTSRLAARMLVFALLLAACGGNKSVKLPGGGAGTAGGAAAGTGGGSFAGTGSGGFAGGSVAGTGAAAGSGMGGTGDAVADGGAAGTGGGGIGLPPYSSPADAWRGAGCGRPLPFDQPTTRPGLATGYKHYRVAGTGANLTDTPDPAKAAPRTFWVRVPPTYNPNRPYRVVYQLSGCDVYENAKAHTYNLFRQADGGTDDAIYVAVDVPEDDVNGGCYDHRTGLRSQEWEAFQLIQEVVDANYCADLNHIYVTGGFGGSWVADMWGCYYAGWPTPARKFGARYHVRGQLTYSGGEPAEQPTCGGPVAALWVHDTGDPAPIAGSLAALARVGRVNHCDTSATAPTQPWHPEVAAIGPVCKQFTGCPADSPVVFCQTTGMTKTVQSTRMVPASKLFFDEIEAHSKAGAADGGAPAPDAGAPLDPNACRPEQPDRCAGACVNLQSDDANCGACGHACDVDSTCGAGKCTTPPVLLQQVPAVSPAACPALTLAVADGTLYWAERDTGRIMSAPTSPPGAPPRVLATGEEMADEVAVRGGRVFWLIQPNLGLIPPSKVVPSIRTVPAQGGAATSVFVSTSHQLLGFVPSLDGQQVYLGSGGEGLLQASTGGGAPVLLATDSFFMPSAMAIDGTKLVVTAGPFDGNGDVYVVDLAAGMPAACRAFDPVTNAPAPVRCRRIGRGQGALGSSVAVQDGKVYWPDLEHVAVNELSPPGSSYFPYSIVTTTSGNVGAIAMGTDAVYFTVTKDPVAGDWIGKAALAPGSRPVRIARGAVIASSIATDGARVYFATPDCRIMSVTP